MVKIAFHGNSLSERGTSVSLYDYAYYNKYYLGNESIIMYDKNGIRNVLEVIDKFRKEFKLRPYNNWQQEADNILKDENCDILYMIKSGEWDGKIASNTICKTVIHCVFNTKQPHGHVYGRISSCIGDSKWPIVPHMINLPNNDNNSRKDLNIPKDALVFGRIGGMDQFDIPNVHKAIDKITEENPNIYFLLVNTNKFCKEKKNIIHHDKIIDLNKKVEFINTCDAMIHARKMGETFGNAIAEFSIKNKPVITCVGSDNNHLLILKDKAIIYNQNNVESIYNIFKNFDKNESQKKDWNAYNDYLPERVMNTFNNIFIKPLMKT